MKIACALAFVSAATFSASAYAQDEITSQDELAASEGMASEDMASEVIASTVPGVAINNFHEVSPELYRSGRPTPAQLDDLVPLGIKTVLSLETYMLDGATGTREEEAAARDGLTFVRDEMSPLPWEPPTVAQIEQALAIITDPANQPVLVHCYHGSDRTGLVIGAYHIRVDHWTAEQAIEDMKNYGHSPLFYGWDKILYQIH